MSMEAIAILVMGITIGMGIGLFMATVILERYPKECEQKQ